MLDGKSTFVVVLLEYFDNSGEIDLTRANDPYLLAVSIRALREGSVLGMKALDVRS